MKTRFYQQLLIDNRLKKLNTATLTIEKFELLFIAMISEVYGVELLFFLLGLTEQTWAQIQKIFINNNKIKNGKWKFFRNFNSKSFRKRVATTSMKQRKYSIPKKLTIINRIKNWKIISKILKFGKLKVISILNIIYIKNFWK
jgi:hypothetical protein